MHNFSRSIALALILALAARPLRADQSESTFGAVLLIMFLSWQEDQQEDESQFADDVPPTDTATLVKHRIDDKGHCGFFAKRGLRWHRDFADGSTLQVRCEPDRGSILPGYHIWFATHGKRVEIARCIFDDGFNVGWYYTPAGRDVPNPSLSRVEWVNVDGGNNDGRKSTTGRRIDKDHFTGPEEPYLDVVRWNFNADERRVDCISDKYQYARDPRLPYKSTASLEPYVGPRMPELRRSFTKVLEF